MNTRAFHVSLVCLLAVLVAACGRPDARKQAEAQDAAQSKSQAAKPQSELSKITIPDDFPRDLPIPREMQLQKYLHNNEENTSLLEGLLTGKMHQLVEPLNSMMLEGGWQANLVLPQASNTLMHYTKDGQSVIIELREAPSDVTVYHVTYTPFHDTSAHDMPSEGAPKTPKMSAADAPVASNPPSLTNNAQ